MPQFQPHRHAARRVDRVVGELARGGGAEHRDALQSLRVVAVRRLAQLVHDAEEGGRCRVLPELKRVAERERHVPENHRAHRDAQPDRRRATVRVVLRAPLRVHRHHGDRPQAEQHRLPERRTDVVVHRVAVRVRRRVGTDRLLRGIAERRRVAHTQLRDAPRERQPPRAAQEIVVGERPLRPEAVDRPPAQPRRDLVPLRLLRVHHNPRERVARSERARVELDPHLPKGLRRIEPALPRHEVALHVQVAAPNTEDRANRLRRHPWRPAAQCLELHGDFAHVRARPGEHGQLHGARLALAVHRVVAQHVGARIPGVAQPAHDRVARRADRVLVKGAAELRRQVGPDRRAAGNALEPRDDQRVHHDRRPLADQEADRDVAPVARDRRVHLGLRVPVRPVEVLQPQHVTGELAPVEAALVGDEVKQWHPARPAHRRRHDAAREFVVVERVVAQEAHRPHELGRRLARVHALRTRRGGERHQQRGGERKADDRGA